MASIGLARRPSPGRARQHISHAGLVTVSPPSPARHPTFVNHVVYYVFIFFGGAGCVTRLVLCYWFRCLTFSVTCTLRLPDEETKKYEALKLYGIGRHTIVFFILFLLHCGSLLST